MSRLVTCALAAVLVSAAHSVAAAAQLHFGLKGGVNVADLSGDGLDDAKTRSGFDGGAYLGASFTERLGARIEARYVQRGAKGSIVTPGDDHPHEATWKLNEIEIPVLIESGFPASPSLRLSVFAGPSLSINVGSEIETTHGVEDMDGVTRSVGFGGTLGGGAEWALARASLTGEVRYALGATSIVEDIAGQSVDVKNRGLGVLVGVKLPIGAR